MRRWEQRERRLDYRAGVVAAVIANANRDPKRRRKPYQPSDFFTSLAPPRKAQSWQEQLHMVEWLNIVFGGRDLRRRDVHTGPA